MPVKTQPGGLFSSYKAQYNPETHKLLKLLMDEVKLTSLQRQQMNECLRKGEALPVVRRRPMRPSYIDENLFDLKKNYYFRRRSQNQIVHSGAYEREKFRFLERTVDLEKEKERLRNIMEYGKSKPSRATGKPSDKMAVNGKSSRETKEISSEERLEELINEIEDRMEFLTEMETLGQVKKYEATIKQEIGAKLREMKKIDKMLAQKYQGELQSRKIEENKMRISGK